MQTRHGAGGAGGLEGGGRIRKVRTCCRAAEHASGAQTARSRARVIPALQERELTWKDKLNAASQEKRGGKDKKSKRQEESEPTAAASDPASASSSQQHRQQREADEAQAHEAGEAAAGSDEEAQEKKKQKTAELVDDADSETVPAAAVEAASELLRSPPGNQKLFEVVYLFLLTGFLQRLRGIHFHLLVNAFQNPSCSVHGKISAPEALPEVVELQPALSWIVRYLLPDSHLNGVDVCLNHAFRARSKNCMPALDRLTWLNNLCFRLRCLTMKSRALCISGCAGPPTCCTVQVICILFPGLQSLQDLLELL